MSQHTVQVPKVVVKPGKMLNYSSKIKACAVLIAIMLYVYLIVFIKTEYLKTKRLDRIMEMAVETEKHMLRVNKMDQDLAMKIQQLVNIYDDK